MIIKGREISDSVISRINEQTSVALCGCIEWKGHTDKDGYGLISVGNVSFRVHRIVYAFSGRPYSDSRMVLHTCDNPSCVNNLHLYQWTAQDNANDRKERGRGARNKNPHHGSENGRAILYRMKPITIVNTLHANGCKTKPAADALGVHPATLARYLVKNGLAIPPTKGGSPARTWSIL